MRKAHLLILIAFFLPLTLFSTNWHLDMGLDTGYRFEKAFYRIPTSLGLLSNDLKGLDSYIIGGKTVLNVDNFIVKADTNVGWILNSDDNQFHQLLAGSYFYTSQGTVFDVSVAIGYMIPVFTSVFSITPLFGYEYDYQGYREKDKYLDPRDIGTLTVSKLPSYYHPRWNSLWGGLDFAFALTQKVCFDLEFRYHYAYYKAKVRGAYDSNTPVAPDFIAINTFRAKGWGPQIRANLMYEFLCNWLAGATITYRHFITGKGSRETATSYTSDGLNSATWTATDIRLNLQKRF